MRRKTPQHHNHHHHRKTKLTHMYRGADQSTDATAADNSIAAVRGITEFAKKQQQGLAEMYKSLPDDLQTAVKLFAQIGFVSAVSTACDVPPLAIAMGTIVYGLTAAAGTPVPDSATDANNWVWKDKFDPSNTFDKVCSATRGPADVCGRSHLSWANGTNILPAVTRELDAFTTTKGFSWGGWFTLRDCFTKEKVQNHIVSVLEMFGLDKALSPGQLCSFSSDKFQGTLMTSSVVGLSSEACTALTSELNLMSQRCSDTSRAGGIDFGLAVAGMAAIAVGFCAVLGGVYCWQNCSERRVFPGI